MRYEEMDPSDIDLEGDLFRTSPVLTCSRLISSIEAVGLLSPPILAVRQNSAVPVTGWKRIASCRQLSLPRIPVFMSQSQDDLELLKISFYDNSASRGLSLIEKAGYTCRLLRFGEERVSVIRTFLPLMNIPPTGRHLDSLCSLTSLDPDTQQLILDKDLPLRVASLLTELSEPERRFLGPYLQTQGRNKQQEILDHLFALSRSRMQSVMEFLNSNEIGSALDVEGRTPFQQAESLRLRLKELRYPRLGEWTMRFNERKKNVDWPEEISLLPSPGFEEDAVSVGFSVRSADELRKKAEKLADAAVREGISDLFGVSEDD